MSAIKRKVRRLERYRAKIKGKTVPEIQGKGKAEARAAKAINLRTALALKKKSGKGVAEYESLDLEGLKSKLSEARKDLFNARFQLSSGQLERVSDLPAFKKRIARILTLIKQKEAGAES